MNESKVSVSAEEIAGVSIPQDSSSPTSRMTPAVPWLARVALAPFVLVLPLLCLVAIAVRLSLSRYDPGSSTLGPVTSVPSSFLVVWQRR